MADGENIGRVSIDVQPDFDQAELFRQVKAATAKIPDLRLKPKILVSDVNAAIREVNKKKLAALTPPVKLTVVAVNKAIKAANKKPMVALTPPIKITARNLNAAIKEANSRTTGIKLNVSVDKDSAKKAGKDAENAARTTGKLGIRIEKEVGAERTRNLKNQLDSDFSLHTALSKKIVEDLKRRLDNEFSLQVEANKREDDLIKRETRASSERTKHAKEQIKEIETTRSNAWKHAMRLDKDRQKSDNDTIKRSLRLTGVIKKNTQGIGRFAANIIVVRQALALVRISSLVTLFGFLAQAISSAVVAAAALASVAAPALAGALVLAAGGATAFFQASNVLKFALEGVSDALGGLNETLDEEKFSALTPAAQSFVLQLEKLKPLARGAQQALQEGLFKGLSEAIEIATPLLERFLGPLIRTAEVLGELSVVAAQTAVGLGGDFTSILVANNLAIDDLGRSAINFSSALVNILAVSAPLLVQFSESTRQFSLLVRGFVEGSRESGRLQNFLLVLTSTLGLVFDIATNLGVVLVHVFRAALPVGLTLAGTIERITGNLADLSATQSGQESISQFFRNALPAIREFGALLAILGKEFIKLAQQPGLLLLLQKLQELVPVLGKVIGVLTAEFGPVLIETFTQIALLFADIAGASGPLNIIVGFVGKLAEAIRFLIEEVPFFKEFATAIFLAEAAMAALAVQAFILSASGFGAAIVAATTFVVQFGAALFGAEVVAAGLAATLGGMAAAIALPALAIAALGTAFIVAWKKSKFFRDACQFISDAALAAIPGLESLLKTLSDVALGFMNLGDVSEITNKATKSFQEFAKANKGMKPGELVKAFREANPNIIGAASATGRLTEAQKKQKKAQKELNDPLAEYKKAIADIGEVGIPEYVSASDKSKIATDALGESVDKSRNAIDVMKTRLSGLGSTLETQRTLVDKLKNSIEDLKNIQIEGTTAFSDAKFALDQQTKALELQEVQLKLAGVAAEDPAFAALKVELDKLRLEAQKVDLTESLQLDPLRRQFDKTINPIKELSLSTAISEFNRLTAEHTKETAVLDKMQIKYDNLNKVIERTETATRNLARTSDNLSKSVGSAEIIKKPMAAADKTLKESNKAIVNSTESVRQGLVRPFRLATQDINRVLGNLPQTASRGRETAVSWAYGVGNAIAGNLMLGLQDGMRSFLQPGSSLFKLLHEEIPKFIRENKGPISYDQGILVPAGVAIMEGLTTGLRRGFEPVKGFLGKVGPSMEEFVPDSMFGKRTAEFLIDVAAGKKPNPDEFFKDLVPTPTAITGGIVDPRLGFLHKTLSLLDTQQMAASLAKTFGGGLQVTSTLRPGAITSSGNLSDHGFGTAADISNGNSPTPEMDALSAALKPLFGTIVKQLIWRDRDQNRGFSVPGHMNHVHVAFLQGAGFSMNSGKIGKSAVSNSPFAAIFAAASQKFGVPAALLQAITKAESGFDSRAGSYAGAKGLMQLLPATFAAQHVGSNIFDPQQNIFAGAKYIAAQLKTFKNVRLALAAYNAGPGNAALGLRSFGETIAYVARVLKFLKDFGGFRAMGGPTTAGSWNIVGEKGPEIHFNRKPGFIMSNSDVKEMVNLMREIRDTGGLRQQTTNISTQSKDPEVIAELLEIRKRRQRRAMNNV